MEIIQQRSVEIRTKYHRSFYQLGQTGGFWFDCDKDGNVDASSLNPDARRNFAACLTGMIDGVRIIDEGAQCYDERHVTPKIGRCSCGGEVHLDRFTNTCDSCGKDYNRSGQELAPREQWGEETGESVEDILSVDSTSTEELLE